MKILALNVWDGGKLVAEVQDFLVRTAPTVDVLCLQETEQAFLPIRQLIESDFTIFEAEYVRGRHLGNLTIMARKGYQVTAHGVLLNKEDDAGLAHWVSLTAEEKDFFVCNVHGIPHPGDKLDTPERLRASDTLLQEGKSHSGTKVFIGDFNLNEHSESVSLFEQNEYRNLIKEYDVKTTRNHHAWDMYDPSKPQFHSDYAFVSRNATVKHFEVLPDIVSDHQPLLLELE